ncbi:MAG: hypothetical protein H0T62_03545 [Parachlamydiaceae bacterium]|nr:hypothetical protein [Parachlamydiaceae bacterium]
MDELSSSLKSIYNTITSGAKNNEETKVANKSKSKGSLPLSEKILNAFDSRIFRLSASSSKDLLPLSEKMINKFDSSISRMSGALGSKSRVANTVEPHLDNLKGAAGVAINTMKSGLNEQVNRIKECCGFSTNKLYSDDTIPYDFKNLNKNELGNVRNKLDANLVELGNQLEAASKEQALGDISKERKDEIKNIKERIQDYKKLSLEVDNLTKKIELPNLLKDEYDATMKEYNAKEEELANPNIVFEDIKEVTKERDIILKKALKLHNAWEKAIDEAPTLTSATSINSKEGIEKELIQPRL